MHETIEELLSTHQAPVYIVHFTQAAALERAQSLMSINMCSRAEKDAIAAAIGRLPVHRRLRADPVPAGAPRHRRAPRRACCRKYRRLVETLAQAGLLKVICGTDTLGVGINVPIRTVLFTGTVQIRRCEDPAAQGARVPPDRRAAPAGPGYDTLGTVIVQAPEHVIDNEKALAKAGDDPKKRRKVVRKKPPEGASAGAGRPSTGSWPPIRSRSPPTSRSATRCCST